jgi:serine protease Do
MKTVKLTLCILCAAALTLSGGYLGAMLAYGSMQKRHTPIAQPLVQNPSAPSAAPANGDFEAMNFTEPTLDDRDAVLSLPDLFDMANPAVVAISTEIIGRNAFGQSVSRPSSGSGFFVTSDGYIVTNNHVIENAGSITVLTHDGQAFPAEVIGRDPNSDLAVIKVDAVGFPFLAFGDSNAVRVGEQVAAIGNPLGQLANSMTVGYVSALNRDVNIDGTTFNKLQMDAAVNRGNSGGPLLNTRGEVIGVVSAKSTGSGVEGLGFAIPSSHAMTITAQLMEYGFVRGRALLGVVISDNHGQVRIVNVSEGSAAEKAGLQVGDIILEMRGEAITSFADLRRMLDTASPGDLMVLKIERNGQTLTLLAVLEEYRPIRI